MIKRVTVRPSPQYLENTRGGMTADIEIDEFCAFNLITGLNGSGKTQFLKMLNKGTLEISIDGRVVTDTENKIRYFSYEDFWLNERGSGQFDVNKELTRLYTELDNVLGVNNEIQKVLRLGVGTSNLFTSIQKLLRMTPDERLDHISGGQNEKGYKAAEEFIQALDKDALSQRISRNQGTAAAKLLAELEPYLDGKSIWDVSKDLFIKALLTNRGSDYLKEGFTEVFQKYINEQNRFILEEGDPALSVSDLRKAFSDKFGPAPWAYANDILDAFSTDSYEFRYRYETPTGDKKAILRNGRGEEVSETVLSSGEKTVLALTLFVYQNLADKVKFPEVLLLDEIDATLHPKLCGRFLDVINRRIVVDRNTVVFMATHNPSSVASAANSIPVFVKHLPSEKNGSVSRFYDPGKALRFLSEGFMTLDQGVRLYQDAVNKKYAVVTEGKNIDHIRHAIEVLKPNILDDLQFLEGGLGKTGRSQLKTLFDFFAINGAPDEKKIVFVWDWDAIEEKGVPDLKPNGGLVPFILERNTSNTNRGIENMYDLDHPNLSPLIRENDEGGLYVRSADKDQFLDKVLSIGDQTFFKNYEDLINQFVGPG